MIIIPSDLPLFTSFLAVLPDATFVFDSDGRVHLANSVAESLFGYAPGKLQGTPLADIVSGDPPALAGQINRQQFTARCKDGNTFAAEMSHQTVDIGGQSHALAIVRDTHVEQAHVQRLLQAVEQSASLVIIADAQGNIEYVNRTFSQVTGYTPEEAIGQNPRLLKSGKTSDAEYKKMWETISGGEQWRGEFHNKKKDGDLYWALATVTPVRDSHGEVTHYIAIQEDITLRKEAELEAVRQRALAEALRNVGTMLASTLNFDDVLQRILETVERVVPHDAATIMLIDGDEAYVVGERGYTERAATEAVLHKRFKIDNTPNLKEMIDNHQPYIIDNVEGFEGWVGGPEVSWVRSYAGLPIIVGDEVMGFLNLDCGSPGAFTEQHIDILQTFASQMGVAARNARLFEDLQVSHRELDAYSHTIAHDLKAPLHLIGGHAELLRELFVPDNPALAEHIEAILKATQNMTQMVNQLLLLAHARSGDPNLSKEVEINPLVTLAAERFAQEIAKPGIMLDIAPDMPPALGNARLLEEVFANLIGNALKYLGEDNKNPRVSVRAIQEGQTVRYEVQDNGVGIHPSHIEKLFQSFTRINTGKTKGHGLGLEIVRRAVTRMGGQVGVESTPGEGSIFWFSLKAARPESEAS